MQVQPNKIYLFVSSIFYAPCFFITQIATNCDFFLFFSRPKQNVSHYWWPGAIRAQLWNKDLGNSTS